MNSNISGVVKPDRSASHDSTHKRRASRHPVASKNFKNHVSRRKSTHRSMSRKGEIMIAINLMDGDACLAALNQIG